MGSKQSLPIPDRKFSSSDDFMKYIDNFICDNVPRDEFIGNNTDICNFIDIWRKLTKKPYKKGKILNGLLFKTRDNQIFVLSTTDILYFIHKNEYYILSNNSSNYNKLQKNGNANFVVTNLYLHVSQI